MQHQQDVQSDSIDFWIYAELAYLEFLDPFFGPEGEVDYSSSFTSLGEYWPFALARSFVRSLNLVDEATFAEWVQREAALGVNGNKHQPNLPIHPENIYRDDWISWVDFLEYDCPLSIANRRWPLINLIQPDSYFLRVEEYQRLRFQAARLSLYKQAYGHCKTENCPLGWARMLEFLNRMQRKQNDESLLVGVDGMLPDGLAEWGFESPLFFCS